jgi:hypothetical protein
MSVGWNPRFVALVDSTTGAWTVADRREIFVTFS